MPQERNGIYEGKEYLSCHMNGERIRDADQGTEMEFHVDNSFLSHVMKKR